MILESVKFDENKKEVFDKKHGPKTQKEDLIQQKDEAEKFLSAMEDDDPNIEILDRKLDTIEMELSLLDKVGSKKPSAQENNPSEKMSFALRGQEALKYREKFIGILEGMISKDGKKSYRTQLAEDLLEYLDNLKGKITFYRKSRGESFNQKSSEELLSLVGDLKDKKNKTPLQYHQYHQAALLLLDRGSHQELFLGPVENEFNATLRELNSALEEEVQVMGSKLQHKIDAIEQKGDEVFEENQRRIDELNSSIEESLENKEEKKTKFSFAGIKKFGARIINSYEKIKATPAGQVYVKFSEWMNDPQDSKGQKIAKKMLVSALLGSTVGVGAGVAIAATGASMLAGGAADLLHKRFSKKIVEKRISNEMFDFESKQKKIFFENNGPIEKISKAALNKLQKKYKDTLDKQRQLVRQKYEKRNHLWNTGIRLAASFAAGGAIREGSILELFDNIPTDYSVIAGAHAATPATQWESGSVNNAFDGTQSVESNGAGSFNENQDKEFLSNQVSEKQLSPAESSDALHSNEAFDNTNGSTQESVNTQSNVNNNEETLSESKNTKPALGENISPKTKEVLKAGYATEGDGITHIIKRQFEANPELAEKLGVKNSPVGYFEAAKKLGYVGENGEIRLDLDTSKNISYLLEVDPNTGEIVMNEYNTDGNIRETHTQGAKFEATDTESNERFVSNVSNISNGGVDVEGGVFDTDPLHQTADPDDVFDQDFIDQFKNSAESNTESGLFETDPLVQDSKEISSSTGKEVLKNNTSDRLRFGPTTDANMAPSLGEETWESGTLEHSEQNPNWRQVRDYYMNGGSYESSNGLHLYKENGNFIMDYSGKPKFIGSGFTEMQPGTQNMLSVDHAYNDMIRDARFLQGAQPGPGMEGLYGSKSFKMPNGQFIIEFDVVSTKGADDALRLAQEQAAMMKQNFGYSFDKEVINTSVNKAGNISLRMAKVVSKDEFYHFQNMVKESYAAVREFEHELQNVA